MKNTRKSFFLILIIIGIATIIGLLILVNFETLKIKFPFLGQLSSQNHPQVTILPNQSSENKPEFISTPSLTTVISESNNVEETEQPQDFRPDLKNYFVLMSTLDGNFYHLFLFNPQSSTFSRLSNGDWNEITPEISPDGKKIAFSSNRNGYWNLYVLDLITSEVTQLTDNFNFVANPTWSPDGLWIAYENYHSGNLDIFILSTSDSEQGIIELTNDQADNFSPEWSPDGRSIVFVTSDDKDSEIWKISLDNTTDRLVNLSNNPDKPDQFPEWSPDGQYVSWSIQEDDQYYVTKKDIQNGETFLIGSGKQHIWNDASNLVFSEISMPNYYLLVGYNSQNGLLQIPPFRLPGKIFGMDSSANPETLQLLSEKISDNNYTQPSLWTGNSNNYSIPENRSSVVELPGIEAPFAYLHDAADESFYAMKNQVSQVTGWDFLSSLKNAYLPLTEPPFPNMQTNWLYTARAIEINPASLYANWMVVVKENYFGQVFWRIYLRARYQDGSQGMPLSENIWDFNARYTGDPRYYETGGSPAPAPEGYWVDFTDIALRYGWERNPSLSNWRTYFDGTLFNQFIFKEGLDWDTAMSEIYPPELLSTATQYPTQALTLSPTPIYTISPTSTLAPTITLTPTFHPTWTPAP